MMPISRARPTLLRVAVAMRPEPPPIAPPAGLGRPRELQIEWADDMGVLDPPTMPPWLDRSHVLSDLGDEGIELIEGIRRAAQAYGSIDSKPIDAWFEKVRAAKLPESAEQTFEAAVASLLMFSTGNGSKVARSDRV